MSLYRKYRPQTFPDVVGQDHIVTTLEKAAEQGKLVHAYLFAGSRGTGKTSVARILAKILMTQDIDDEVLCKQIDNGVREGSIVDLLEIDAASNRGIDDMRELIEKIQFSPVVSSAKVYIIDEVHMLTKEAFNALLKTLEEPPPYAYFILATTEINKIPVTIQSRCQCFPFRHIREEDIIRRLQYIADQERITIDREALRFIARSVEGGLRDAISLLDQLRSLEKITVSDVEQRIGITGREYIEEVFQAIDAGEPKALIETVRKVEDAGIGLDIFLRELLSIIRDGLHSAIEEGRPTDSARRALDVLLTAIKDVRIAPVPGLVVEAALLSLCIDTEAASGKETKLVNALDSAIPKKEEKEVQEKKEMEAEDDQDSVTPTPSEDSLEEATVEAPDLTLSSVQGNWSAIIKETSPASVKMSLKNGRVDDVSDQRITISFSSSFHRDKVANTEASRAIEEVIEKIFKRKLHLECILEEQGFGSENGSSEEAVNLAEAAAEIF